MMEGWKEVELGTVLSKIIGGGTPSKSVDEYWNGDIFWCSVKDMSDDKFKLSSTEDRISQKGLKNSSSNLIPANTVITATRMGLGRAFINTIDMSINQDLKALIPNPKIDNSFLLWTIIANRNKIESLGSGATVKGIKLDTLKSIKINLPPIITQQNIASILSAYDDLIENNLKRIKLLEEKAQQTYEEWFVRMRFPGYEDAVIDEETGLPEGWDKVKLGDKFNVQSSKRIYLSDYTDFGIPFFRGKEITQKSENSSSNDILYISEERFLELKSKFGAPKYRDILLTAVGTLGNLYMVQENDGDFYFKDGNLIWIRTNDSSSSYFLLYLLQSEIFQSHIRNIAIGSSHKALTIKGLKDSEIVYPSSNVVSKFDEIVIPLSNAKSNIQNQNQRLKEARDILLPRLMSGMIEV